MAQLTVDLGLALRSFDLEVAFTAGAETVALVGPSGAGKTTILRCIAGLQRPDRGVVDLDGVSWLRLAPERRSVGYVFQDYALFPHLSVRRNVAFGGGDRVDELLERFGIARLAGAKPRDISGGERQRVALARALARDPAVLLLDEPLSALDTDTRLRVRTELGDLLAELGLPTLIVTHDFRDAMALADRIGVVVDGRLRQIGAPADLIAQPADGFVVTFTGGTLLPAVGSPRVGGGTDLTLDDGSAVRSEAAARGRVGVAVYPWEVAVTAGAPAPQDGVNVVEGVVRDVTPEGGRLRVRVGDLVGEAPADTELHRGARAWAAFRVAATRITAG